MTLLLYVESRYDFYIHELVVLFEIKILEETSIICLVLNWIVVLCVQP